MAVQYIDGLEGVARQETEHVGSRGTNVEHLSLTPFCVKRSEFNEPKTLSRTGLI